MGGGGHGRLYVCLQHLSKFHPAFDGVLAELLRRDERAHLAIVFNEGWGLWKETLATRFRARFGTLAFHRVHFVPSLSHAQFLALVSAAAVALDPFPIGGCITSLEALACGTPVVTLPRAMLTEHFTAGMYRRMDVPQVEEACVASDESDYVRKAIAMADDAELRQRISHQVRYSLVLYLAPLSHPTQPRCRAALLVPCSPLPPFSPLLGV